MGGRAGPRPRQQPGGVNQAAAQISQAVPLPPSVPQLSPATAQDTLLLPGESPLHVCPLDFGLMPPGTVGLLLGLSTLTSKGVTVHTGVTDSDYEGEIQMIMSSSVPWTAQQRERVTVTPAPVHSPRKKGNWRFWKHRTGRDFSSRKDISNSSCLSN